MKEKKDFKSWMELKAKTHFANRAAFFKEGEIWWAAVGENVGVEINGKSKKFSRPILIFKKLSRFGFLAIPLTSQPHQGSWYAKIVFQDKEEYAVLAQIRMMSTARLYDRMGELSENDFQGIKTAFIKFIK